MEIIIRAGIREGKTTVATLIAKYLSQYFNVILEDDDRPCIDPLLEQKIEALKNNNLEIRVITEQTRRKPS